MGLLKAGRLRRQWRGAKTLLFLLNMLISLLFLSAPVLLAITDSLVPSLRFSFPFPRPVPLFSPLSSEQLRLPQFPRRRPPHLHHPIGRHTILCDGPRLSQWPYLGITTALCLTSLGFVSLKASYLFMRPGQINFDEIALVACSLSFTVGAYRGGIPNQLQGEEEALLPLYKIDIE